MIDSPVQKFGSMSTSGVVRGQASFGAGESSNLKNSTPYIHPSFHEAEGRGAEPAILRQMGERLMSEFIFSCRQNGVEPNKLSDTDIFEGVETTLKGMVNPKRDQYASVNFDSFRDFYRTTREDFKHTGARVAERHTQGLIDTLQASQQSSLITPLERSKIEDRIVNESRVAASAYRSAGMTQRHVVAMFKDNTDVAGSAIVGRIEKAIDEDGSMTMARRSSAAKQQIRSVEISHPQPSWAAPRH